MPERISVRAPGARQRGDGGQSGVHRADRRFVCSRRHLASTPRQRHGIRWTLAFAGQEGSSGQEGPSLEAAGEEGACQEGAGSESSSEEGAGQEGAGSSTMTGSEGHSAVTGAVDPSWKNPITWQTAHERYASNSAKASDVARQLSFAGIAAVWLFSGGATQGVNHARVQGWLLYAGLALVIALFLDLLQYTVASLIWATTARCHEQRKEMIFQPPRSINYPALICFWFKLSAVAVAYVFLGIAISHRIVLG